MTRGLSRRALAGSSLLTIMALAGLGTATGAQAQTTAVEVAIFGEPPTLDPVLYTSDSSSIITQHFYETLYTFTRNWEIAPLLASALPVASEDGKTITIALRQGVLFHDGRTMTPADVVASLARWARVSPRGKLAGAVIESIEPLGDDAVQIRMSTPFAPLLTLLATNNAAAVIMPAELNDTDEPVTEFIGTGPYRLLERRPDQFTRVVRFDDYVSPPGEPDGYAGSREAIIDEVRFVPVPNATTRLSGILSGQYAFADVLTMESYPRIEAAEGIREVITRPSWPTFMVLNTKGGQTADVRIRKAMQAAINPADMLLASFGEQMFYDVEGSIFGKDTFWHVDATEMGFNQPDPDKARALLAEAGYDGTPIRLLTSLQFDHFYKQTLVAEQNLTDVGFNVEIEVLDWASVMQKRTELDLWEGFIAHHGFIPEPSLITFISPSYAGWWDTPEKTAALAAFNAELDPAKRQQLWAEVQRLLYEQASTLVTGHFYNLAAISDRLQGYEEMPWPAFWNVSIAE
jgi:peptide/nickel transport system substrate-binding protein